MKINITDFFNRYSFDGQRLILPLSAPELELDIDRVGIAEGRGPFSEKTLYIASAGQLEVFADYMTNAHVLAAGRELPEDIDSLGGQSVLGACAAREPAQLCTELRELLVAFFSEMAAEAALIMELMTLDDLAEIIAVGSRLTGFPMAYTEIGCVVQAMTLNCKTKDKFWAEMERTGRADFRFWGKGANQDSGSESVSVEGTSFRSKMLFSGGTVLGALLVLVENGFTSADERRLKAVCHTLEAYLIRNADNRLFPKVDLNMFIMSLLEGRNFSESVVRSRLSQCGWELKSRLTVINIHLNETHPIHEFNTLSQRMPLRKNDRIFFFDNDLVLITDREVDSNDPYAAFSTLAAFMTENGLSGGMGREFSSMKNIRPHYIQACKALEFGSAMGHPGPLFNYNSYAIYHFLENAAPHCDIMDLCLPAMLELKRYDAKNGTELLHTLSVFLSCGKSTAMTAEKLYIHKNSVNYRVKRAEEILKLNLNNGDQLFETLISLKALEFSALIEKRE